MILSDNETKLDLLNNQAIAKTIVSIIRDSKESVSIGVHGDWGAGKSSILAMVEELLKPQDEEGKTVSDDYDDHDWDDLDTWDEEDPADAADDEVGLPISGCITVRFNSWQYQGFEDAKIALMSAIVKALQKEAKAFYKKHPIKGAFKKIKETCKNIWSNIDKLSLAKNTAKIGVSVATGTAPLALLNIGAEQANRILTDETVRNDFISKAGALLKPSSSETSSYKEMADFHANYKELFKAAHIEKLVVLIDDLDRCLPKVAIETLEAVRMFLSMEKTAFIIAADDEMIRYSVKEYFPRVSDKHKDDEDPTGKDAFRDFSEKYLEKLIQVPLHIPIIGIREAQLYILLLLIEAEIGESKSFEKLVKVILEKLHKPWALEPIPPEEIKEALGEEDYNKASNNIRIAKSIDKILAENTAGNPRNIKRFVNMLLLRTEVAHNRGFDKLEMAVLAKMMLAEQYNDELYKAIANELRDDGTCPAFDAVEIKEDQEKEEDAEAGTSDDAKETTTKRRVTKKVDSTPKPVAKSEDFAKLLGESKTKFWMDEVEPSLAGIDLRPYYFACKGSDDFFFSNPDEMLRELISVIRGGSMNVSNNSRKINDLDDADARKLFRVVTQDAFTRDLTKPEPPKVIEGIRRFVEFRTELRDALGDFLLTLQTQNVGMWALGDWDSCLPKTCSARTKYLQFVQKIGETNINPIVKAKAKQIQE